ncbi:hypothetical protein G6M17_06740 [Agrobacterium tumefaciens]|uniref:hypothetical protein n=1 Tax=Rhizobium/Agrobacterium group TaxID=227290 RepID=UPI0013747E83|nr:MULTISPECIES: hypothetical protein [Rhizobium/Agrobacterium group]MCZ7442858.1 hypothetical protein [Rhizobium rhizogenes]NSZ78848.1 hypothetical protein [Agrobacterium tumefaciens]
MPHKIEETEIQAFPTPGFLFLEDPGFGGKQTGTGFSLPGTSPVSLANPLTKRAPAPNKERQFIVDFPMRRPLFCKRNEG